MQVSSGRKVNADLNVTPMIDVVLVLLIIFMVVSPKQDKQVPVVVPQESQATEPAPSNEPLSLVMEVAEQGTFSVLGTPVADQDELKRAVKEALDARKDKIVFLYAHPESPYERAVQAMDAAREAGAKHVGIIGEPPPKPAGSSI